MSNCIAEDNWEKQAPLDILKSVFGYPNFIHQQAAIVEQLIAQKHCLAIMPTGSGKSLCYQLPMLKLTGVGIVISPLIALMEDQVGALQQNGINAAYLNSTQDAKTQHSIREQTLNGSIKILYIAPERMMQTSFIQFLKQLKISLFAIDEAHCVSMWGHDFRPHYQQLSQLTTLFPDVPRMALTATADLQTQADIQHILKIDTPPILSGFDRPNLFYRIAEQSQGRQALLAFIKARHPGETGIVYCLSRKSVEQTAKWLQTHHQKAVAYHAGLETEVRQNILTRFLQDDGIIVVATIAFGMGIDKPNVRFVAHLNLPKSIEAYVQETGRAGRDGLPADAWMNYGYQDVLMLQRMIDESNAHETHKKVEQQKLDALLGFCETTTCRRQVLLGYFGQKLEEPCNYCDNCLQPVEQYDVTVPAQKALSCAYRTGQKYGVQYLIDVLIGSTTTKIKERNHTVLSVYGIGKTISTGQWTRIFRQLIIHGYLKAHGTDHGGLQLTEASRRILKNQDKLHLRKLTALKNKRSTQSQYDMDISDEPLWESLRKFRAQQSKIQNVPRFTIFHDKALLEIVELKPTNLNELYQISGIGKAKIRKYGQKIINIIDEYLEEHADISF